MKTHLKIVLGSLAGAAAIHVASIACSLDARGTGSVAAADDTGGSGTCGSCTVAGPIEIKGPVAIAQPIEVKQPLTVLTAETDAARFDSGAQTEIGPTSGVGFRRLTDGPFVLQNVLLGGTYDNPSGVLLIVPKGTGCVDAAGDTGKIGGDAWFGKYGRVAGNVGADERYDRVRNVLVKKDETLCVTIWPGRTVYYHWWGYRPYDPAK